MWSEGALREVRTFLMLSEELQFSRAAQRLGLSHARVSQLVRSFEGRSGGKLFDRTSRRVHLTPLGVDLGARLRPAYEGLMAALEAAVAGASEIAGTLRVGVTVTTDAPSIHRLLDAFHRSHPECRVAIAEIARLEPYEPLRRGEIDVLFNWLAVDEADLIAGPVIELRDRVLAVGTGHRLAQRQTVSIEDLAGERVKGSPSWYPRALEDSIHPSRTPSGRRLRKVPVADPPAQLAARVARGEIVALTMVGLRPWAARDGVVLVPFSDLPPMPLGLIWCAAQENARIRAFAQLAAELHEQGRQPPPPAERESPAPGGDADNRTRAGDPPDAASVELRELETFLTVAQELHFARAADRLGVTPSRTSQIIRALEAKLGGRLFARTSRHVLLTQIGEHLRADLTPPYAQLELALQPSEILRG